MLEKTLKTPCPSCGDRCIEALLLLVAKLVAKLLVGCWLRSCWLVAGWLFLWFVSANIN